TRWIGPVSTCASEWKGKERRRPSTVVYHAFAAAGGERQIAAVPHPVRENTGGLCSRPSSHDSASVILRPSAIVNTYSQSRPKQIERNYQTTKGDNLMQTIDVIRAWKDADYRA